VELAEYLDSLGIGACGHQLGQGAGLIVQDGHVM